MKTKILYAAVILLAAGCTTHTETMLKNDKGETRYCYLTNDHTLISMGAMSEYNKCLNEAGTAGFRKTHTTEN